MAGHRKVAAEHEEPSAGQCNRQFTRQQPETHGDSAQSEHNLRLCPHRRQFRESQLFQEIVHFGSEGFIGCVF